MRKNIVGGIILSIGISVASMCMASADQIDYVSMYGTTVKTVADSMIAEYWLYDMDYDDIRELIIKYGNGEAGTEFLIYTISDGEVSLLGTYDAANTGVSVLGDKDGIILDGAHMGYQWETQITKSGQTLTEKNLYKGENNEEYYGMSLESCDCDDMDLLEHGKPYEVK